MVRTTRQGFDQWTSVAAALCVAGCASLAAVVTKHEEPRADSAYLYGRFSLETHERMFMQSGAVGNAGLVVRCDSDEEIIISFRERDALQLLRLKPAQCALAEMLFKNELGVTLKSSPLKLAHVKFDLAPGTAYYAGDWVVVVERSRTGGKIYSSMKTRVSNFFDATTAMVRVSYPRFASFAMAPLRVKKREEEAK